MLTAWECGVVLFNIESLGYRISSDVLLLNVESFGYGKSSDTMLFNIECFGYRTLSEVVLSNMKEYHLMCGASILKVYRILSV